MVVLHKFPFTSPTNQELEKIYSGRHTISYKNSEIESFAAKINNRISDENDENVTNSLYVINELNEKLNEFPSIFKNTFSLMDLNISSLKYHVEERSDISIHQESLIKEAQYCISQLQTSVTKLEMI